MICHKCLAQLEWWMVDCFFCGCTIIRDPERRKEIKEKLKEIDEKLKEERKKRGKLGYIRYKFVFVKYIYEELLKSNQIVYTYKELLAFLKKTFKTQYGRGIDLIEQLIGDKRIEKRRNWYVVVIPVPEKIVCNLATYIDDIEIRQFIQIREQIVENEIQKREISTNDRLILKLRFGY